MEIKKDETAVPVYGTQVKDVAVVWTLLGVFVLAWAISSQALLYLEPSELTLDTIGAMLMRSYWSMFGQYNFNEFQTSTHDRCVCSCFLPMFLMQIVHADINITYSNGSHGVLTVSPVAPYLLPLMLAVFIIFTVLILFNLVIAMFKYLPVYT